MLFFFVDIVLSIVSKREILVSISGVVWWQVVHAPRNYYQVGYQGSQGRILEIVVSSQMCKVNPFTKQCDAT